MPSRFWWLGVDHAESGAALLLNPKRSMVVLWTWRPRQQDTLKVFDVAICQGSQGRVERVETLHDVGELIAGGCQRVTGRQTWGVGAEEVYVGRNARTSLGTAKRAGMVLGPLESHAPGREIVWVEADAWRKTVLPAGYAKLVRPVGMVGKEKPKKRHFAKAASLKFIPPRLPPLALQLQRAAGLLETPWPKLDHCTDAGGVAEHCYVHEREVLGV